MTTKSQRISLLLILLVSLIGAGIVVYTTQNGPWGYTDSVSYLATGRNIANGTGIGYYEADGTFSYTTIQPFFYPLLVSPFALAGVDVVHAARWLGVAAFLLSICLGGWLFLRTGKNPSLGVVTAILLGIFPHMVMMASAVMTESVFILILLLGAALLLNYFSKGSLRFLVTGALVIGLLPITKYVGVACLLSGALSVFFLSPGKFWKRIGLTALFSALAVVPVAACLGWVYSVEGHSLAARTFDLSLAARHFEDFRGIVTETIWKWLPYQETGKMFRYLFKLAAITAGITGTLTLALLAQRRILQNEKTDQQAPDIHTFLFFWLASVCFLLVFAVTHAFTLPTPDINNRTLLPLFVTTLISLVGFYSILQSTWFPRSKLVASLPWLVVALSLGSYIPRTLAVVDYYQPGDGLTAYAWDRSGTIEAVRGLPAGTPVISNDWELLMLWTERPVRGFWVTFPADGSQTSAYGSYPADANQSVFCAEDAALVIFDSFETQVRKKIGEAYLPQIPTLFGGLTVYGEYPDGTIYLCP